MCGCSYEYYVCVLLWWSVCDVWIVWVWARSCVHIDLRRCCWCIVSSTMGFVTWHTWRSVCVVSGGCRAFALYWIDNRRIFSDPGRRMRNVDYSWRSHRKYAHLYTCLASGGRTSIPDAETVGWWITDWMGSGVYAFEMWYWCLSCLLSLGVCFGSRNETKMSRINGAVGVILEMSYKMVPDLWGLTLLLMGACWFSSLVGILQVMTACPERYFERVS